MEVLSFYCQVFLFFFFKLVAGTKNLLIEISF